MVCVCCARKIWLIGMMVVMEPIFYWRRYFPFFFFFFFLFSWKVGRTMTNWWVDETKETQVNGKKKNKAKNEYLVLWGLGWRFAGHVFFVDLFSIILIEIVSNEHINGKITHTEKKQTKGHDFEIFTFCYFVNREIIKDKIFWRSIYTLLKNWV